MAILFNVDRTRIVRHISNVYKDKELLYESTCAENAQVQKEGDRVVKRIIKYYNLDMIIAVGYRVNSKRGTLFRQWASQVLKQYLINGYSINKERCIVCQNSILELNNEIKQIESRIKEIQKKICDN